MRARRAAGAALLAVLLGCGGGGEGGKPAASTLVIGIDVSGSFRDSRLYDDAVDFASNYIYAHLAGLDGLKTPTALFVGSVGGARPGEPKSFHPINDFQGRTVDQIAQDLRTWFPPTDEYTDFNAFFQRVSQLVKERGLILAPLNVVVLSDGVPDVPPGTRLAANENPYQRIDLSPLEYLSRSVTVRLLYASPTVGDDWKRLIKRKRVRLWTEEAQVMAGWHQQVKPGVPLEAQHDLWKWVADNVDFRVRAANLF
ncbi:MAG TPA: hypothetical protein VFK78_06245 [Gemmatimonadales bacterium]|nr:hypothetical protein [Gemmatimonadales bacterium]